MRRDGSDARDRRDRATPHAGVHSVTAEVLHVVGPGMLRVVNGRLAFDDDRRPMPGVRLDAHALRQVICFGRVGVSDAAVAELLRRRVTVHWQGAGSGGGGTLHGDADASGTLLRMAQRRAYDDARRRLSLACGFVGGRAESIATVARKLRGRTWLPSRADPDGLAAACDAASAATERSAGLDDLRGVEGVLARRWFERFRQHVRPPFAFPGRRRRPPPDPVNALLSLSATLLTRRVEAALRAAGWEPAIGFLHDLRPGRPSLACDVAEPLRAELVEQWTLGVTGRGRTPTVRPEHFVTRETPAGPSCRLVADEFGRVLARWESWAEQCGLDARVRTLSDDLAARVRDGGPAAARANG